MDVARAGRGGAKGRGGLCSAGHMHKPSDDSQWPRASRAMDFNLLGGLCARGLGRCLRPLGDTARRGRVHRAHRAVVGSLRGLGALWTVDEARLGVLLRGLSPGGESWIARRGR